MKMSKKTLFAAGAVASMFAGAALIAANNAPGKAATAPQESVQQADRWAFLPEIVAEMDGKKYTKAEIVKMVDEQLANSPFAAMITPESLKQMIPRIISGMVDKDVLLKLAAADGIKPSTALMEKEFDEMLGAIGKDELEMIKQQLAAQNQTIESYKKELCENTERQEQSAIRAWVMKNIEPKVKVSEQEVKDFYEKNKAEFSVPEKVSASHILIVAAKDDAEKGDKAMEEAKKAARTEAEQLLADIKSGKVKFEEAAEEKSGCPSGKNAKGSLGEFSRDQMVPAFSKAAFELQKGEISEVVETPYGFHIIRCDEKVEGSQMTLADANVRKYIEDSLKGETIQKLVMERLEEAKKKYNVKIFVEVPELPAIQ